MQLFRRGRRLISMPRDHFPPEDLAEAADKAARERLEAQLKRALWAQQAARSWAALTAENVPQPNL